MREIKFRAWDKLANAWVATPETLLVDSLNDDDIIAMQYTGFKDKNEKEIYFGDIIEFIFYDEDNRLDSWGGTAQIVENMSYGVGLLFDFDDDTNVNVHAVNDGGQIDSELWEDDDLWREIEVIGNIYENPELMA